MDPKTTAIVLIEYQNDFVTEGGALHSAVRGVMQTTNMLANTVSLVEEARALGATIMMLPISFGTGYSELGEQPYGILKGVVDGKAFAKGSWGADFADPLKPKEGDVLVEGKRAVCGFAGTDLDKMLRARGVETVVLGGFLTNCCVESTMRTAYDKGYKVVTLTDCTATLSEEEQRFSTDRNYQLFSRPLTHDAVLSELRG